MDQKPRHPVTYEHIGWTLFIAIIVGILWSAGMYWYGRHIEPVRCHKDDWTRALKCSDGEYYYGTSADWEARRQMYEYPKSSTSTFDWLVPNR